MPACSEEPRALNVLAYRSTIQDRTPVNAIACYTLRARGTGVPPVIPLLLHAQDTRPTFS